MIEDHTLAGEAHRAIAVAPVLASRLTWRLTVPKRAWLWVSIGMQVEAWNNEGDGVRFTAGINDGGTFTQLFEHACTPMPFPATANGSRSAFRWRSTRGARWSSCSRPQPEPTAPGRTGATISRSGAIPEIVVR